MCKIMKIKKRFEVLHLFRCFTHTHTFFELAYRAYRHTIYTYAGDCWGMVLINCFFQRLDIRDHKASVYLAAIHAKTPSQSHGRPGRRRYMSFHRAVSSEDHRIAAEAHPVARMRINGPLGK